jgi:hypothetical protein
MTEKLDNVSGPQAHHNSCPTASPTIKEGISVGLNNYLDSKNRKAHTHKTTSIKAKVRAVDCNCHLKSFDIKFDSQNFDISEADQIYLECKLTDYLQERVDVCNRFLNLQLRLYMTDDGLTDGGDNKVIA